MANEDKKDFNAMLMDSKDMPKVQIKRALKNMVEIKCTLPHLLTMTK